MRFTKPVIYLLIASVLTSLFAGCSQDPYGIFASIEREQEIVYDRNLPADLTIGAMTRSGTTYFVAAGPLYHRERDSFGVPDSGGEATWRYPLWDAAEPPATDMITMSVVSIDFGAGERTFAVYTSLDGTTSGVYEVTGTAPFTMELRLGADQIAATGASIDRLFVVDDGAPRLVVGTAVNGTYSLRVSSDGTSFAEVAGTSASAPYVDAASNGSLVAFVRPDALLVDTDGVGGGTAPSDEASAAGLVAPARFTGAVHETAGGLFWFADDDGFLYSTPDLATWTRSATAYPVDPTDEDSDALAFTDFAVVPRGSETFLLVGTAGRGYRVVSAAAGPTTDATSGVSIPTGDNYASSDLTTATIRTWYVDPDQVTDYPVVAPDGGTVDWTGSFVFAGTPSRSLWRGLWPAGESAHWEREASDPGLFGSR